jgi:hypothetical protein
MGPGCSPLLVFSASYVIDQLSFVQYLALSKSLKSTKVLPLTSNPHHTRNCYMSQEFSETFSVDPYNDDLWTFFDRFVTFIVIQRKGLHHPLTSYSLNERKEKYFLIELSILKEVLSSRIACCSNPDAIAHDDSKRHACYCPQQGE